MLLVYLFCDKYWFFVVISIVNFCFYIYDFVSSYFDRYKIVFNMIKNKFIRKECELLFIEESELFQESNWDEEFFKCLK